MPEIKEINPTLPPPKNSLTIKTPAEFESFSSTATPETPDINWPKNFLRERLETAQALRQGMEERGVEVEAAGLFDKVHKTLTVVSVIDGVLKILDGLGIFDPSGRKRNLQELGQKVQVIWNDDLLSDDEVKRTKAIEVIKNSSINNAEGLTFQCERALRDLIVACKEKEKKGFGPTIQYEINSLSVTICMVLSLLEGLYQRDDIGSCSLTTNTATCHGWQYNKDDSRTTGKNFCLESSWYGQKDTCILLSQLLESTSISSDEEQSPWRSNNINSSYYVSESIKSILLLNWKTPINGIKVPHFHRPIFYRTEIYETIKRFAKQKSDPLFLQRPESEIPPLLLPKVKEFKDALQKAYLLESAVMFCSTDTYNSEMTSWDILEPLQETIRIFGGREGEEILKLSSEEKIKLINQLRRELGENI